MNRASLIPVLAFFVLALTTFGAAEFDEDDFELDFDQEGYEVGEVVDIRIDAPEEAENYTYIVAAGSERYETDEMVLEHRLEEHIEGLGVRVLDGENESVTEFSETIEVAEQDEEDDGQDQEPGTDPVDPSDEFELELIDDEFEVRELLESRLHVPDEEANYRLNYRIDGQSYTTTGEVFRHRITGDEEELTVRIRDSDGEHLETLTESFDVVEEAADQPQPHPEPEPEPDPEFEADVEDLEVDYSDSGAEITVSGEEFREIPEILMGESISAWHQVILQPAERSREARAGAEVELEENTDYSLPEGLATYSVVDVSGENLDVVDLSVEAEVDRSWASTNDLLVTSRHADVSFYVIRDGEWTPVESNARVRNDGIEVTGRISLTDDIQIGIAGDPEGLDHGSFAAGPEGGCEELGEDDPVPPGWSEIPVNCDIHEERERQQDRIIDRIDRMENRNQIEPSEAGEMRSEVNSLLDDYEVAEAENVVESHEIRNDLERTDRQIGRMERMNLEAVEDLKSQRDEVEYLVDQGDVEAAESELDELNREMSQHQGAMQEVRQYFRQVERIELQYSDYTGAEPRTDMEVRTAEGRGLPEELEGGFEYERSEEVQDLYDQAYGQAHEVAEGEITEQEFQETVNELEETKESQEDFQRIRGASSTYQSLERIKEEDLSEEQQQQVESAESLLIEEQNVEEASEIVEDLERELELEEARNFIMELLEDEEVRAMIREVIAEVMPGF